MARRRCTARTRTGRPCRMAALRGQQTCFAHSPSVAAKRAKARRRGGQRHRVGYATAPVPVATMPDLQAVTAQLLADVLVLGNTEARARAAARLIVVAAKLIEDGDLVHRIEALEQRMTARGR